MQHDPVPNLQRQQQQQDRTRHPVRHLRGPPDADAKQMEQEVMTDKLRAAAQQVLEKIAKAHTKIDALCLGNERWTMSVPIRPDHDHDLVISGALYAAAEFIRSALAEQPAEQEPVAQRWQPIETAPKGRIVLVYYKNSLGNGRTMRARYYLPETLDSDTTESGWADEGWYEESEAYEYLMPLEHDPTHWMPLPAGPDTAPQPAIPPGYKLVPVEPTEAMCEEGLEDEGHTIRDGKAFADALYRAMLNAAPTPPAPAVEGETK